MLETRRWHSIKAYRHLRNGSLQVDQEDAQTDQSPVSDNILAIVSTAVLKLFVSATMG